MYLEDVDEREQPRREGLALALLLKAGTGLQHGALQVHSPSGASYRFRGARPGPDATLRVNAARGLRRAMTRGDLGFAQAFMAGEVDTPDLDALLELAALNEERLTGVLREQRWFRLVQRAAHLLRRNSRPGSRRNIRAHYDLGNEFYRLWLDESMTYSGAVFEHPDQSLADAQRAKYRRLLDLLQARASDHVLEIGCGWGGFALAAARSSGCRVTGVTLSSRQLGHARALARNLGLDERLEFRLQDYRDVQGQFDHVVSVEMFEAVGEQYWNTYFKTLAARLRPGGRAALQIITIDAAVFERYRTGCDFIQRYIFPGGMLAPAPLIEAIARRNGLSTVHRSFHAEHYVRTLELWRERFEAVAGTLRGMGFDERFQRMWRYYLSYCRAGFRSGRVDLMQTVLCNDGGGGS